MTTHKICENEGDKFVRDAFLIYFICILITTIVIGVDFKFLSVMIGMAVIPYIFLKMCVWLSELNQRNGDD